MRAVMQVPARAEFLADIRAWVNRFVSLAVTDAGDRARMVLALHEVAANIIEHAYRDRTDGQIVVAATLTPAQVMLRVDHRGVPLERSRCADPVFDGTVSRGFGVWLAERAADDVYHHSDARGCHSTFLVHNLIRRTSA